MTQAWEIEGFLESGENGLFIDGVSAVELAREHGTPLFVYSERRIQHNIDRLKLVAGVIDCPLKLCYAAKAASTMAILKVVKDSGCDIEVNSGGELWKALEIGFTGDQIIFNGTSKEVWELEMAIGAEIYAIQVDSLFELSLIEETAARLGKRANISLRLVPEIESDTHSGLQTALLTSKFGMMPDEAFSAFKQYAKSPHLNLAGIHLHIGSQNPDPHVYAEAFEMLFASLLHIYRDAGVKLQHVNLGGGFPVDYSRGMNNAVPDEFREKLEEVLKQEEDWVRTGTLVTRRPDGSKLHAGVPQRVIEKVNRRKMFQAKYPPRDAIGAAWSGACKRAKSENEEDLLTGLTLLLEPGRSIIADAGICLTTVRNTKKRPLAEINRVTKQAREKKREEDLARLKEHGGVGFGVYDISRSFADKSITSEHWLLTDAGFNILLSMETYKWYYHLISADRAGATHDFPYKVAGPLCDGGDVYFDNEKHHRLPLFRHLPRGVEAGEVLALLNCGAYSLSQASQYNGRFLPAVVLIREDGRAELVRKRDDFADLVSNDVY